MVETRRLNELTSEALDRLDLPQGPLFVALSGGADSAALAYLTSEAGVDVRCVHVNHGLPASPEMARAAAAVASCLGLGLETFDVTLPAGPSPEGQARQVRYAALTAVPGPVLTAHTLDDNAETVIINLVRGAGPRGLMGIPGFRAPNIYRPMLTVTRADTREMAGLAGLPYVDDPMNEDLNLVRNRVRRTILPLLAELNPRVVETVARTGELLFRDTALIESLVPETRDSAVAAGVVRVLPRPIADRVLADLLDSAGIGVTADRMERVWDVVRGVSPRQDLVDGKSVIRSGPLVIVG